jgi:hypothetical protein
MIIDFGGTVIRFLFLLKRKAIYRKVLQHGVRDCPSCAMDDYKFMACKGYGNSGYGR